MWPNIEGSWPVKQGPAPTLVPAKTQENKCKQATGTTDKPAKAKRIKRSASRKTRQPRSSPESVGASEAEEVPTEEPQVIDEDTNYQKAVEESMKDAYALPKGSLPLVESEKVVLGVEKGGQDEGQAGPNPDAQAKDQMGSDAENLKLAIKEPVLLEELASSSGTLSSLQHLSRDFSFGDHFFSGKHSDAEKNAETEVESM
nr:hypothetical protein [Tanacetum cinerariifolium]